MQHGIAALVALSLLTPTLASSHTSSWGKRHAALKSAFSQRTRTRRQNFLSTTQPTNLASGAATADEGCTLWIQPWADASCLAIITYSPGLIYSDFLELNSGLDSACTNLESNAYYCIDTDDSHEASDVPTNTNNAVVAKPTKCSSTKKKASSKTPTSSKSAPATKASKKPSKTPSKTGGIVGGLLELDDPVCGQSDPSKDTTDESGPNGKLSWLNCGISKTDPTAGWTYPSVQMSDIVYKNLSSDGLYATCAPYFQYFEEAEKQYGIPAIFVAAFAMQESSCNPNANGDNGGAWGLMQITTDKCGGAPSGNCNDPEFNVMTGAKYFKDVMDNQCGGNPLCTVGQYNGWTKGMSYDSATAAASGSCCVCQNNLDYMHQFFNAWIQGISGQDFRPYNNLQQCDDRTGNS